MSNTTDSLRSYMAGRGGQGFVPTPGVLVVGGGKGGVGASTVSALMAVEAARAGQRVLLVDGDEHLGSLHLLLGQPHGGPGLGMLKGGRATPAELVRNVGEGLDLLPGGGAGVEGTYTIATAERRALFRRVSELYEKYDLVVVDGGSRLESVTAAMTAGVERLMVVTSTDRVALAASYALVKVARGRFGSVPVELIVNQVAGNNGLAAHRIVDGAAERFLKSDVPLAGGVPEDIRLREAVEADALLSLGGDAPARRAAFGIVDRVLNEHAVREATAAPVIPMRREG